MIEMILPIASPKRIKMRQKLWTRAQYDKAVAAGVFTSADKIELIEGRLIQKMPIHAPHTTSTGLVEDALMPYIIKGIHHIRVQMPIALGVRSEPEPDIAVVQGIRRDYSDSHPKTALLIVEIAASSLEYDRSDKASIYAKAGIADYWIVNINERVVEVYRDPVKVNGRGRYQTQLRFGEGESITPLAFENATIAVNEILP